MSGRQPLLAKRLIVVCRPDPTRRYDWLPPQRPEDLMVALDGIAQRELVRRRPLLFDDFESWEERSAGELRISGLMAAIREHPAVAAAKWHGYSLIDFAEPRLRIEIARLLRGFKLARSTEGVSELICDPGTPVALLMGVRAGLGLDPAAAPYVLPPMLPGSQRVRAAARPLMRTLAACSRPERVRVAAVVAGKLSLALAALPVAELRAAGVGAMPFPGLDHGNGALLALRRRLPLLATYGSSRAGPGPVVRLPERLELDDPAALDRALTLLVGRLLAAAAPELAQAVGALAGLQAASSLRALLLSGTGYGASRLLISWARERGLRVGSMQHGIYAHKDVDDGERRVDVVFGWGEGTVEQTLGWGDPRPRVCSVGVPGMAPAKASAAAGPPSSRPERVLLATSSTVDAPLTPAAICEAFVEVIAPGLERLSAEGVEVTLRPHPTEDPTRYRRLLDAHGLDVRVTSGGSFPAAAADVDIVISALSSVAFEAAGMGRPVLLWLGGVPRWVRQRHMVAPWAENVPGMFEGAEDFTMLVDGLLELKGETLALARELARRLARFAEPFRADRFAEGLRSLAS